MDDEMTSDIPYVAHEADMARMERSNYRLTVALIIAIVCILLTNLAWLYVWAQYDYVSDTYSAEQGGDGINIFGGGDVAYESKDRCQEEAQNAQRREIEGN